MLAPSSSNTGAVTLTDSSVINTNWYVRLIWVL